MTRVPGANLGEGQRFYRTSPAFLPTSRTRCTEIRLELLLPLTISIYLAKNSKQKPPKVHSFPAPSTQGFLPHIYLLLIYRPQKNKCNESLVDVKGCVCVFVVKLAWCEIIIKSKALSQAASCPFLLLSSVRREGTTFPASHCSAGGKSKAGFWFYVGPWQSPISGRVCACLSWGEDGRGYEDLVGTCPWKKKM